MPPVLHGGMGGGSFCFRHLFHTPNYLASGQINATA